MWEENALPIQLFQDNATQWRTGAMGVVGLDYTVFFHELDRKGITGEEYDQVMKAIRIIESEALNQIYKDQKRK